MAAALLLGAVGCGSHRTSVPDASLVVVHANVVDVRAGTVLPDRTIVVAGGRIRAVAPSSTVAPPRGARVLDASGAWVIPGLWDMHVHALWDPTVRDVFLARFLIQGVTGIRDMGGVTPLALETRDDVAAGRRLGPRIVAAGPIVDGPNPVQAGISVAVDSPERARAVVDSLADLGVDFIKVYTLLPRDAYYALMAEAAARGLPAAGHVPAAVTPAEAANAGQRSVEHMRDEIAPFCRPADPDACAPAFEAFRRNHTWQVPTLVELRAKATMDDTAFVADPMLAAMPATVRADWLGGRAAKMRRPASYWTEKRAYWADELWLAGRIASAGIPILAGTDAGASFSYPGRSLHEELELLVRAGLAPLDALRAATLEPARYLEAADSLGTVEAGRVADLVLLDANPIDAIGNTRRIRAVVRGGTVLDRAALDSLDAAARAAAE